MIAGIKRLFILLLIFVAGFGIWQFVTRDTSVHYSFTTAAVTRGDITSTVTATGELSAVDVVEVGTQVSGRIEEIYVDFNSEVKAGQLIALIDPSVAKLELRAAELNLAVSLASVKSARANLKDAQKKLTRNRELLRRKLIAPSEVDTSEADVEMKQAALEEAISRAEQSKTQLERRKTDLNYTRITSPITGVVIDRKVDAGQTVAAGYQTPTLFKIAKDLTQMQIKTKVDEADIGHIKAGQKVTFRIDAFPEENFEGRVVQVRIAPETADNVVTYTVIINVNNQEQKLMPGMTANVSIETEHYDDVLRLPTASLRFTPSEELLRTISFDTTLLEEQKGLNEATVWVERNGKLDRAVDIVTGISDNRWTHLVKGGLSEGDKLIINAQAVR